MVTDKKLGLGKVILTLFIALLMVIVGCSFALQPSYADSHATVPSNRVQTDAYDASVIHAQSSRGTWKNSALSFAYNRWGSNASHNKLDALEYASNVNFINWYNHNFEIIPPSHRNLTKVNLSVIINAYEQSDSTGRRLASMVTQYELNSAASSNPVNTSRIVQNREGKLVSNASTTYDGNPAHLLTYRYTSGNVTVTYALIKHGDRFTPVDPYVRLNAFTISKGWWIFSISATSYNIYFDFYNYVNAVNFKNFITGTLTISSIIQDLMAIVIWSAVGVGVGPFSEMGNLAAGVIGSLFGDLVGTTSPLSIAGNVNTLFSNEWDYSGDFRLVFTLNVWEDGLVPQYAVWGRINPGNSLFEVFSNVQPLSGGSTIQNYLTLWNDMATRVGINHQVYMSSPPNWQIYAVDV